MSSRIERRWWKREPRTKDGKIKRIDRSRREGWQPCGFDGVSGVLNGGSEVGVVCKVT